MDNPIITFIADNFVTPVARNCRRARDALFGNAQTQAHVATPAPPPAPPSPILSPDTPTKRSPLPKVRRQQSKKTERTQSENSTTQFVAMLTEAVDRDAAQQDMERRLSEERVEMSRLRTVLEEHEKRVEFLNPLSEETPALQRALEWYHGEMDNGNYYYGLASETESMLKLRLAQSHEEMSELLDRVYDGLDAFANSVDRNFILPPFQDEGGNLRNGVVLSRELTVRLRTVADCARPLRVLKEALDRKKRRVLQATKLERQATSPEQQSRRAKRKSEKVMSLSRASVVYQAQRIRQDERERRLLTGSVKGWLIASELVHFPSDAPRVAEEVEEGVYEEGEGDGKPPGKHDRKQDEDGKEENRRGGDEGGVGSKEGRDGKNRGQEGKERDEDGKPDAQPPSGPKKAASAIPTITAGQKRQQLIDELKQNRKDLQIQRRFLKDYRGHYANDLAKHLYAFPRSSVQAFDDTLSEPPDEYEEKMEEALGNFYGSYITSRKQAMKAGIDCLPLTPDWAASANDVEWDKASSHARYWTTLKLNAVVSAVEDYKRGVKRAQPDGAHGSPEGKKPRTGPFQFSPKSFDEMPSVRYEDILDPPDVPILRPDQIHEQLRRLQRKRDEERKRFREKPDGPEYHRSQMVPDDEWLH